MCGIAGLLHRDSRPVDPRLLVRMTRTLTHRGPDEEGYFVNASNVEAPEPGVPFRGLTAGAGRGQAGLGHRRLSIIDLASGQQPLCNEDGTVWISFNGEIYNFQELHAELEGKGHVFRTHSDTEAIVHAYEEWGEQCAERLRGMFAIAIWDERKQRLYLARDRLGKKPLYYLDQPHRFVFGSELKAILEAPDVPREIDPTALSDFLSLLYVPAPRSIYKAIRKLPAAHYAVVDDGGARVAPYWDLQVGSVDDSPIEVHEGRILESLEEATRIRMMSEVPLGAFLSGGVDSSAVVSMMSRSSPDPVRTSSISFSEAKYDESDYAKRVAGIFGAEHTDYSVTPDVLPIIEKLAWHYDEPFGDSSSVPTYYVSKTAREKVTVALSGDGGDENFAGYRRYYFDDRENRVRGMVPRFLQKPVFGSIGRLYPKADWLPQVFRGKAFLSNVARDPVAAYCFSMSAFKEEEKRQLFRPEVHAALGGYESVDLFREHYARAGGDDHLAKILYLDIKTYLCEDILVKVDRASMAVSLEVRCPVLDHEFMEYAATIPTRFKLNGTDKKHVFKRALRRDLPDDLLWRAKMGFAVPIEEWLRNEVKEYARDLVLEGAGTREFFQRSYVEKLWNQHQSGLRNRTTELWLVMMFNLWHRTFAAGAG